MSIANAEDYNYRDHSCPWESIGEPAEIAMISKGEFDREVTAPALVAPDVTLLADDVEKSVEPEAEPDNVIAPCKDIVTTSRANGIIQPMSKIIPSKTLFHHWARATDLFASKDKTPAKTLFPGKGALASYPVRMTLIIGRRALRPSTSQ